MTNSTHANESTNLTLTKKEIYFLVGFRPSAAGRIKTERLRAVLFTDEFLGRLGISADQYRAIRQFTVRQSHLIRKEIEA